MLIRTAISKDIESIVEGTNPNILIKNKIGVQTYQSFAIDMYAAS